MEIIQLLHRLERPNHGISLDEINGVVSGLKFQNEYALANRIAYSWLAHHYQTKQDKVWEGTDWTSEEIQDFIRFAGRRPKEFLEIGPGVGYGLQAASKVCENVTAIELSPVMAKFTRQRVPTASVREGNIVTAGLEQGKYDIAVSIYNLHSIPTAELPTAVKNIKGALRTGGRLVASTSVDSIEAVEGGGEEVKQGLLVRPSLKNNNVLRARVNYPSEDEFREPIEAAGFEHVRTTYCKNKHKQNTIICTFEKTD
jgi:SAM-dependent methyltransferase